MFIFLICLFFETSAGGRAKEEPKITEALQFEVFGQDAAAPIYLFLRIYYNKAPRIMDTGHLWKKVYYFFAMFVVFCVFPGMSLKNYNFFRKSYDFF